MPGHFEQDVVVVGGGFYGVMVALYARRHLGLDVVLIERESQLMTRASSVNQARVHGGYHYPRSLVTARRSRVNYPRFVDEFRECVDSSFEMIYAISARGSRVTASQFVRFCRTIGARVEPATRSVSELFEPTLVEAAFRVEECAFDAAKLRDRLTRDLAEAGVDLQLGVTATRLSRLPEGRLCVHLDGGRAAEVSASNVLNCTYASLNGLMVASGLQGIALKHELTEVCLVEPPEALRHIGVTLMCGSFFSCMPFPTRGLHSLTHVRYTPHRTWLERGVLGDPDALECAAAIPRESAFPRMQRDAQRYLPGLSGARYVDSLWEVKTVLPRNEVDDGRPILFAQDSALPGFSSLMGSKIDNVYDILDLLASNFRV